jgi:post-segregation antitoxin (ccd killing protein)
VYHIYVYVYRRKAVKTKLTVTVDEDLVPKAKAHARARGVSLSQMIEEALRDATTETDRPFSAKWRGKFVPATGDDPRRRALSEKYL